MICTDKLNGKKKLKRQQKLNKQIGPPSWKTGPKERVNEFDRGSVGLGAGSCYVGCQVMVQKKE